MGKRMPRTYSGRLNGRDAYMTLEASLMMPLAVILIACLMVLALYLYTVSFLNQAAYLAAFRASLEDTGREEAAGQALESLLEEGLIPFQNLRKEISVTLTSVTVVMEAELELPGTGILPLQERTWKIYVEKTAQIRDPAVFIRELRRFSASLPLCEPRSLCIGLAEMQQFSL